MSVTLFVNFHIIKMDEVRKTSDLNSPQAKWLLGKHSSYMTHDLLHIKSYTADLEKQCKARVIMANLLEATVIALIKKPT